MLGQRQTVMGGGLRVRLPREVPPCRTEPLRRTGRLPLPPAAASDVNKCQTHADSPTDRTRPSGRHQMLARPKSSQSSLPMADTWGRNARGSSAVICSGMMENGTRQTGAMMTPMTTTSRAPLPIGHREQQLQRSCPRQICPTRLRHSGRNHMSPRRDRLRLRPQCQWKRSAKRTSKQSTRA